MSESVENSGSAAPVTVDGLNGVVFSYEGHRKDIDPSKIAAYNFRQPGFLSQRDMGQLGLIHRNFLQNLSNRLGTFLRMEVSHDKKSLRCTNQQFKEFCDSVEPPTHLTLFQIAPLEGVGILELRPATSLALANRLLGGRGMVADLERNPTEIEIALLDEIILILLKEWVESFEQGPMGTPSIVGHEANTRFLQIAADDMAFFVMRGELSFGELTEAIQLAVPFAMIDALTNSLSSLSKGPAKPLEPRRKPLQWRAPYAGIQVELRAEWEVRSIAVSEALGFGPGHLVELPQELIDRTKVYVSDKEEFYGTIGVEDGRLAVHLNERISKE